VTVDWFDLGQRLHAAHHRHLVPRLTRTLLPPITHPVAVRARMVGTQVQVSTATPTTAVQTATGSAALTLLGQVGVRITAEHYRTLLTDDTTTGPALAHLARAARADTDAADVAAHLTWWAERADFPGSGAAIDLPATCRTRWITGTTPAAEQHAATWRAWLGITEDSAAGMLTVLAALEPGAGGGGGLLAGVAEDDTYTWGKAQSEHADGWNWTRPDTTSRAATGLRARCDAADLYTGALMADPLYRTRAVHTGHVITGTATPTGRHTITVTSPRLDARLRTGNPVRGWTGAPADTEFDQFTGTIAATTVTAGHLVLTLTGVTTHTPTAGTTVTVTAESPNPYAMRHGRSRYRRLYAARRSWLTTGRTPTPSRRPVPLEVLIAGADET